MEQQPPFGYRPEDLEPDIQNNPDSDAGLNRERVRKSRKTADRIEIVMVAVFFGNLALYLLAEYFVSPATVSHLVHYQKMVMAFVVGLFVGAQMVAPPS